MTIKNKQIVNSSPIDPTLQPLQTIERTAAITGLAENYLRSRAKMGTIPVVQIGSKRLIHVPNLLRQLGEESTPRR